MPTTRATRYTPCSELFFCSCLRCCERCAWEAKPLAMVLPVLPCCIGVCCGNPDCHLLTVAVIMLKHRGDIDKCCSAALLHCWLWKRDLLLLMSL